MIDSLSQVVPLCTSAFQKQLQIDKDDLQY